VVGNQEGIKLEMEEVLILSIKNSRRRRKGHTRGMGKQETGGNLRGHTERFIGIMLIAPK